MRTLAASFFGLILIAGAHSIATAQSTTAQPLAPLLAPTPSPAASSPSVASSPTIDIEGGASYESLTNNQPAWNGTYLQASRKSNGGHDLYGLLETTDRFSRHDQRLTVGDYFPLAERWSAFLDAAFSPTHLILPSSSFGGGAQYGSGAGWYEGLAARHTTYNTQSVNSGILSVESYWKSFRAYYGITVAQLNGTGTDVAHTFAFAFYYGLTGNNSVGLAYTTGREIENVGAPTLLVSHVDNWTIRGRQSIGRNTSIHYELWTYVQGTSYTHTGGSLGFDYRY
jgi:YaiO family outer membrane protein